MDSDLVYLAQTDTTVGFLSANKAKLCQIKNRSPDKKFILSLDSFTTLVSTVRAPKKHRKFIRNATKTTFVMPKKEFSFRVIPQNSPHSEFVKKFKAIYSTSANITGEHFEESYAYSCCDTVVLDYRGLTEQKPSSIVFLYKKKRKKTRG